MPGECARPEEEEGGVLADPGNASPLNYLTSSEPIILIGQPGSTKIIAALLSELARQSHS